nr:immunoglobulin light chain junction region [Macaca mulatta]MOX07680.1 immunoglobulin light chain junction region [Macaca mulatta]
CQHNYGRPPFTF